MVDVDARMVADSATMRALVESACDECGCQMDTGDDRVCDACAAGE